MAIEVINPYNNQFVKEYAQHSEDEIKEAIERAHHAFETWKNETFQHRSGLMKKAAQILRDNKNVYAGIMTKEMGKTTREGVSEIEKCALGCDFYAENAEKFLADEKLDVDEGNAFIAYQPLGIVLAVMPWNFPFWQVFRFAAPSLMAGNVGILKHASNVPGCAMAIEEVFNEAGFPEGVFTSLLIESKKVNMITDDARVKAATLTGSEGAGSKVAERAGRNLMKTVLELGGSDPFIVLEDADIEKAAETAVKSRMINCGQSCIAAKRFIVVEKVKEDFLKAFKEKMEAIKLGDPGDEAVDYGPMATEDLAEKLLGQVQKSVKMGAKIITGGSRPSREGAFFTPTILTDVTPGMPAFDEELFGPVATVFIVKDAEEAVNIANQSLYGLGGSVWGKNEKNAIEVARKVESGCVYVNAMMASDPRVPFGGIKHSGYGRELSHLGIREFMNVKTIWAK